MNSDTDSPTPLLKKIDMEEKCITEGGNNIIQTNHLENCVGISVWSPRNKIACLYHASRRQLEPNSHLFKTFFLELLLEKITDSSHARVNVVSSYWSNHVLQAIKLMQEVGFKIYGLSIPDALIEYRADGKNVYINKKTVPEKYLDLRKIKGSTMAIDSRTGQIGFKHDCSYEFCKD